MIPHLAKLFEFFVYYRIKIGVNYIVINKQHGFRPGKSTILSSVIFTTYISEVIKHSRQADYFHGF